MEKAGSRRSAECPESHPVCCLRELLIGHSCSLIELGHDPERNKSLSPFRPVKFEEFDMQMQQ